MNVLFWAIAVIAFVIAEICTVQLVSIWFAAGSFITMIACYFYDLSTLEQLGLFIVSSVLFLLISLPFIKRRKQQVDGRDLRGKYAENHDEQQYQR